MNTFEQLSMFTAQMLLNAAAEETEFATKGIKVKVGLSKNYPGFKIKECHCYVIKSESGTLLFVVPIEAAKLFYYIGRAVELVK